VKREGNAETRNRVSSGIEHCGGRFRFAGDDTSLHVVIEKKECGRVGIHLKGPRCPGIEVFRVAGSFGKPETGEDGVEIATSFLISTKKEVPGDFGWGESRF